MLILMFDPSHYNLKHMGVQHNVDYNSQKSPPKLAELRKSADCITTANKTKDENLLYIKKRNLQ